MYMYVYMKYIFTSPFGKPSEEINFMTRCPCGRKPTLRILRSSRYNFGRKEMRKRKEEIFNEK